MLQVQQFGNQVAGTRSLLARLQAAQIHEGPDGPGGKMMISKQNILQIPCGDCCVNFPLRGCVVSPVVVDSERNGVSAARRQGKPKKEHGPSDTPFVMLQTHLGR